MNWFRYVSLSEIEARKAEGWAIVDDFAGCCHSHYAVLMIWSGAGVPSGPKVVLSEVGPLQWQGEGDAP